METSLHRQLKQLYAGENAQVEVPLDGYRIDAIDESGRLVEIQLGSLAAVRDKITALVTQHQVLLVKPIVVRKTLVKRTSRNGSVVDARLSPKRGSSLDLFEELVHFTSVFPHRHLILETPLIEVEECCGPATCGAPDEDRQRLDIFFLNSAPRNGSKPRYFG